MREPTHGARPPGNRAADAAPESGAADAALGSGAADAAPGPGVPAAQVSPEQTAPPTHEPACAEPNAPARTLDPVAPETPPLAQQQGISGDVTVLVSLDTASRITNVAILQSSNVLLNEAALRAARASTFRTEIRDCRPLAANYAFIVEFNAQ